MKAFGPAPKSEFLEVVPTPVGWACLWCEEMIVEGDSGIVQPYMHETGTSPIAQHRECFLRSILGSLGHLQQKCSCYGGTEEDPPGMTKREAAKVATEYAFTVKKG